MTGPDGKTYEMSCVDLHSLPQWTLASLRIDLERQDAILFGDNEHGTRQNVLPSCATDSPSGAGMGRTDMAGIEPRTARLPRREERTHPA
jgi:hypothetical protein